MEFVILLCKLCSVDLREVERGSVELLILQTVFCKLRTNNTFRTTKLL